MPKKCPKGMELAVHLLNELGPLTDDELNAALWKCDTEAYRKLGEPITEFVYVRGENGPVACIPV